MKFREINIDEKDRWDEFVSNSPAGHKMTVKRLGRIIISDLIYSLNFFKFGKDIRILMYHLIDNPRPEDRFGICVSKENFSQQMEYLYQNGYQTIQLQDLVNYIRHQKTIPDKSIIITFDDGYLDNYLHAYPILKKYNFTATFFIVVGYVGKKIIYDIDKGKVNWVRQHMPWSEIEEMGACGMSFGVHGYSHVDLVKLNPEEARRQIRRPKAILEDRLGHEIKHFSYPHGSFNQEVKQLVIESGFTCACTVKYGLNNRKSDLYELRRTGIYTTETNLREFKKKLMGAYDWLNLADSLKRVIRLIPRSNR